MEGVESQWLDGEEVGVCDGGGEKTQVGDVGGCCRFEPCSYGNTRKLGWGGHGGRVERAGKSGIGTVRISKGVAEVAVVQKDSINVDVDVGCPWTTVVAVLTVMVVVVLATAVKRWGSVKGSIVEVETETWLLWWPEITMMVCIHGRRRLNYGSTN